MSQQLGSWWTDVSKTIFSVQAKPEGFRQKEGRGEKGAACGKLGVQGCSPVVGMIWNRPVRICGS